MHYKRHRYYNPETGQYISSDPIGLAGGLNLYGYVHNPLEWIDPLGLTVFDVGGYEDLRTRSKVGTLDLDDHHVGQKVIMSRLVKGYNPKTGPEILFPKVGHTISRDGVGIISRSKINPATGKPFSNARELLARDISELRRVYPGIPNRALQDLIAKNKEVYPEMRKSEPVSKCGI